MNTVRALALFSGGLDSILACRVIAAQGIEVVAVKFVSPFFDHYILDDIEAYQNGIRAKYCINVRIEDISQPYLKLLLHPDHGFGKNFNPCIDCKIFMLERARAMMAEFGAAFIITGEVLGQRPMSQRRDTLNIIERDSGSRSFLLRPLSAKLLRETEAERTGLVNRALLLDFSGRGRSRQIALAREYGITDFPAPAGGCRLTDPNLSRRLSRIYSGELGVEPSKISVNDVLLLLTGRQFLLAGGCWLVLGRDERENVRMEKLRQEGDILLKMVNRAGPTAILRNAGKDSLEAMETSLLDAASLVVRYGRKMPAGPMPAEVEIFFTGSTRVVTVEPAPSLGDVF